jgi:hypothetical protein
MPNCNFINESEVPPPTGMWRDYETEDGDGWPAEATERRRYIEATTNGHRSWTTDRNGKVLSFLEFAAPTSSDQPLLPKDRCLKAWRRSA